MAASLGAEWIVKGLRMVMDYEYELQQVFGNERFDPGIKTVFIPSSKENVDISSSLVRVAISNGESLRGLVPPAVIRFIL